MATTMSNNKYTPSPDTKVEGERDWLHPSNTKPGPREIEPKSNDRDAKRTILENPLPLTELTRSEARVVMLDWFTELAANGDHSTYSKSAISDNTGISRNNVIKHIDTFVEMGILETEGEKRLSYKVPDDEDAPIYRIVELNRMLAEVYINNQNASE